MSLDELQQRSWLDSCGEAEVVLDERALLERRAAVRDDDGVEPGPATEHSGRTARWTAANNRYVVVLSHRFQCHGSGGVAGKYAFGARTAGANVILGAIYAVAAVLAVGIVVAFPVPMLGVVLGLIAIEFGRAGLDTDHLPLTLGIGVLGVVTNIGIAFVLGALGYLLLEYLS